MSSGANVESIEALRQFRADLCKLAEQVQAALSEQEGELNRTADWLAHTQTMYWKNQLRIRTEDLSRARGALNRKKSEKSPTGARQSYIEEEQAFKRAEVRLKEAHEKDAAVKRWIRQLDEAAFAYRPVAQSLSSTVEADVPRGLARIDSMVQALEAYLQGGPPPEWVKSESAEAPMRRELESEAEADPVETGKNGGQSPSAGIVPA